MWHGEMIQVFYSLCRDKEHCHSERPSKDRFATHATSTDKLSAAMNHQASFGTSASPWSLVSIQTTREPQFFMNQNVMTWAFERGRPQLSTAEEKCRVGNCPLSVSARAGTTQTTVCDRKHLPSILSKGKLGSPLEVAEVMLVLACIRFAELHVIEGC